MVEENAVNPDEVEEPGEVAKEPEVAEEKPEEAEDTTPTFLRDEPPPKSKKGDFIKWCLMHDITEEELKAGEYGECNPRTVDICAYDLEKEGHRSRPKKASVGSTVAIRGEKTKTQIYAHGSPPEALIEGISIPVADGEGPIFEKGMKFGMTVLTLGVRVAQELSNMGIQQARPLVEMARDMRSGEAAAAKSAAGEAAMLAAATVQQNIMPLLSQLTEVGKTSGPDPMKAMMVRTMEPIIQKLMSGVVGGGVAQSEPVGWTRKKE